MNSNEGHQYAKELNSKANLYFNAGSEYGGRDAIACQRSEFTQSEIYFIMHYCEIKNLSFRIVRTESALMLLIF